MGWKIAVILILFAHLGVVGGTTTHTEYPNISLKEAIDSINAKLNTNEKLKPYVIIVLNHGTQVQVLAILQEILLHAKLPLNRKYVSFQLFEIWRKTHNKKVPLILKRALNDSLMDLRMNILWQLHRMGEKVPLDMIEKIASGEGKEHWAVSIPPLPSRSKPKPEGELIREARDNVQMNAIRLLYEIKGKEIAGFLWELLKEMPLGRVWDYTAQIYKKVAPPKKVRLKDFGPGPWTPEQIREYERQRVEWNREVYKVDLLKWRKWLEKNYKCERSLELVFRTFQDARDLRAIPLLIKVLKYNPNWRNRLDAARAIGVIEVYNNDRSAIPELKRALNSPDIPVRLAVSETLIKLGEKNVTIPVLLSIFKKEPGFFKKSLDELMVYIDRPDLPDSEQLKIAKNFLETEQDWALHLLIEIGDKSVVESLKNCLNSPNKTVREKAEKAIKEIEQKKVEYKRSGNKNEEGAY